MQFAHFMSVFVWADAVALAFHPLIFIVLCIHFYSLPSLSLSLFLPSTIPISSFQKGRGGGDEGETVNLV